MRDKDENTNNDEFLLEVNRMRNSLNALTVKNFMCESKGDEEIVSMEVREVEEENPPPLPEGDPPIVFKRTYSGRNIRQESNRAHSGIIDTEDVLKALVIESSKQSNAELNSQKTKSRVRFGDFEEIKVDEVQPKSRVRFAEEEPVKDQAKLLKNPSRESDEVATINDMPWNKKYEYRAVTPFLKPKNEIKALNTDDLQRNNNVSLGFRPIERNRSTEDLDNSVVRPVPLFASKSYQELSKNDEIKSFRSFDSFTKTKSSDDLLLDNIDGARKFTESKTHKLMRIRSTSNNALNRTSESVYENYKFETQTSADESLIRVKKRPMPQPRTSFQEDVRNSKRTSKTIVYVLDKEKDEFVLENPELLENEYENILTDNQIDKYSDSSLFSALLSSRDDCKSSMWGSSKLITLCVKCETCDLLLKCVNCL